MDRSRSLLLTAAVAAIGAVGVVPLAGAKLVRKGPYVIGTKGVQYSKCSGSTCTQVLSIELHTDAGAPVPRSRRIVINGKALVATASTVCDEALGRGCDSTLRASRKIPKSLRMKNLKGSVRITNPKTGGRITFPATFRYVP